MKIYRSVVSALLAAVLIFAFTAVSFAENTESAFDYIHYPEEVFTDFSADILGRIGTGDDYISNRGYDETSLYVSPYWTMKINGKDTPVYATAVYDWVLDRGVVQSFQYIFADDGFSLNVNLTFTGKIKNVKVLPESLGCKAKKSRNSISCMLEKFGTYTFLINNDSQEYAVTLFVQKQKDEDAEIQKYKEIYGAENVAVYKSGVYCLDTLDTGADVIYFKRGSYIIANHINDIRSAEDADSKKLSPFAEFNSKENAVIAGCGTIDFTRLDRQERTLVNLNFCKNTTLENLILLNPNSWTVTAYGSDGCRLDNITVFGYRTNSDGINICGCSNMKITDSFCRNGDDCFSAKATNTEFECHDIEFSGCIGWSNKARCFGITGEVERDIYNISFMDCAVIYRNATWDNDRVGSLAIAAETGSGDINNVTFENIEIYHDSGRPIYCTVYGDGITNCRISDVKFKNIRYSADEKIKISSERSIDFRGKISSAVVRFLKKTKLDRFKLIEKIIVRLEKNYEASNSIEITFENVFSDGRKIRNAGKRTHMIADGNVTLNIN